MAVVAEDTKYVMFENAGEADFYALYLVGFTDKANDPNSIGMFGSGFKLALASALRLGIKVVLYLGLRKVMVRTVTRKVKGVDVEQLVFVEEEPDGRLEEHATNLTLGYGAKDWRDAWGVYRELMANCRDADPRGWQSVYGISPKGRDGFTRVFLEATDDVLAIYSDADRYFKEERHAIFSCDLGRIYPRSTAEGRTAFFCKGVFVLETPDASLYDLDLYRLPISESRNASTANLLAHVLQLYDLCPPEIKEDIIRFAVSESAEGRHSLEGSLYWTQTRRPGMWAEAFRRAFPDHVLCSFSDVEYRSMVHMGRKAVRVTRGLYRLLSANGVVTAEKILRAEQEDRREVFEPEGDLAENYAIAFERVARRLPEVHRLTISFVRLPSRERNVSFLTCSRAAGEYQFSETLLKSGPRAIALALIDAMAQTESRQGKCNLEYERALHEMVLQCTTN